MRFEDLEGLTSLPIRFVAHRFRYEEVLNVLPVSGATEGRDSILVATSLKLAVVTADADPGSEHWMTRWVSWDVVGFADADQEYASTEVETYQLTVHIGARTFHARMAGPAGQRAMRDFVVTTQARQTALSPSS